MDGIHCRMPRSVAVEAYRLSFHQPLEPLAQTLLIPERQKSQRKRYQAAEKEDERDRGQIHIQIIHCNPAEVHPVAASFCVSVFGPRDWACHQSIRKIEVRKNHEKRDGRIEWPLHGMDHSGPTQCSIP
jgi:hypothetical protein